MYLFMTRNIGNIDLSSALYDLGGDPSRIYNRANDGDLSFVLGITPIIGTGKEIGQLIKGEDLVTGQKYSPDDYAWGTLAVVSGGTTRVVGKVVGKIGDLEKKGKALEAVLKVVVQERLFLIRFKHMNKQEIKQ